MAITRIKGSSVMGDRYQYDFGVCHHKKGWAQLDTKQDASYYGNWINPLKRQTFSYCEGDLEHVECDTDEEFVTHLTEVLTWHKDKGYFIGIDGMCSPEIIAAFERLGFAADLH